MKMFRPTEQPMAPAAMACLHPRAAAPRPRGATRRPAPTGMPFGRLDQAGERVAVAGPVRLDDVGPQLGAQPHVAPQVLEAVLLLELLDGGVGGRELGLGDEAACPGRRTRAPTAGQDVGSSPPRCRRPGAVNSTTASAPRRTASSTWAIWTISGAGSPPGCAEAESSRASEVVGENAGSASRIMPLLIMITLAPPATDLGGAAGDVGQRLQERRRGHAVVEGADDRDPGSGRSPA